MLHSLHSKKQNSSELSLDTVLEELYLFAADLDNDSQHASATITPEAPLLTATALNKKVPKSAEVINIFISFVEPDENLLNELMGHLRVMQRQYSKREGYQIIIWHSGNVLPGQDWQENIENHLVQADIILLLVSNEFLSSEFCQSIQIQPALDKHKIGEACVIPVILRQCVWQFEDFGHLKPLPVHGKPVINWRLRPDAYVNIILGIREAIDNLLCPKRDTPAEHQY